MKGSVDTRRSCADMTPKLSLYSCRLAERSRNRRVVAAGELSQRQIDAIRNVRVPDQYADLDKEIKD